MNNKNLVALSENELGNISGGVTGKEVAGTVVEYGTAVVSVVLLGTVGKLLGLGIGHKIVGKDFSKSFDKGITYIPGYGVAKGLVHIGYGLSDDGAAEVLTGFYQIAGSAGGVTGGWFAGRALGKALRKKLGL